MGATGGIALGPSVPDGWVYRPELPGVFLCGEWGDVEFFLTFGSHPLVDVWQVDVSGLDLEDGPDGWLVHRQAIPSDRVRLVRQDVPPPADG